MLIDENKNKKAELLKDLNIYVIINCLFLILSIIGIYFEGYGGVFGGLLYIYVFFGGCVLNVILDIALMIYSVYYKAKIKARKKLTFMFITVSVSVFLNICGNWIAYNLIFSHV